MSINYQTVDFYAQVLILRNIPLSYRTIKKIMFYFLVALFGISLILFLIQLKKEADILELERKEKAIYAELDNKSSKVPTLKSKEALLSEIQASKTLYEKNKETYQNLEKILGDDSAGFSRYLFSLSQATPKGLWITSLSFIEGGEGFLIKGKSLKPDLVPSFIQNLKKEKSFEGKILNEFKVSYNPEEGVMDFIMEAKPLIKITSEGVVSEDETP